MLTPADARRLAERLSAMRGAVMKVGQLMSMDAAGQGVLPAEFSNLLGGLHNAAHTMPAAQLTAVLKREYGAHWQSRFRSLNLVPIAAASIGQVHCAQTHEGQALALKSQYPGVRAIARCGSASRPWGRAWATRPTPCVSLATPASMPAPVQRGPAGMRCRWVCATWPTRDMSKP